MTDDVNTARRVVLCKRCRREVAMKQIKDRESGCVLFHWFCPKCGTLKGNEVDKGFMFRR